MSKIAALLAVLMLAFAASASAGALQDYRSPDARQGAAQDYRSPDLQKPVALRRTSTGPDHRSPDARPAGRFVSAAPQAPTQSSNSFEWGYLAAGIALAMLIAAAAGFAQRRRRHGLAIGG